MWNWYGILLYTSLSVTCANQFPFTPLNGAFHNHSKSTIQFKCPAGSLSCVTCHVMSNDIRHTLQVLSTPAVPDSAPLILKRQLLIQQPPCGWPAHEFHFQVKISLYLMPNKLGKFAEMLGKQILGMLQSQRYSNNTCNRTS